MSKQDWKQSQYYQEDFLASHSVRPGSEEARKMTVTSGLRCLELYRRSGPVGSLVRMLLESSQWNSTKCFLTWKESVTPAKRLLYRLVPSMPNIDETVVPFWPTPTTPRPHDNENTVGKYISSQKQKDLTYAVAMWPTPTARDCKGANSMAHLTREGSKNHTDQLANAVRLWPTPSASDCGRTAINPILTSNGTIRHQNKSGGQSYARLDAVAAMFPTPTTRDYKSPDMNPDSKRFSQKTELNSVIGGQLNPTWVEWLMGFPIGWTDLSVSEML